MANPIDQIEAKTMGAAHAVKAGFNGLRGVFLHLAQEHGEVGTLMKRVDKSRDPEMRREHYPHIRAELLSHERGEVAEVYSVLAAFDATRDIVATHQREALQLEAAIAAVDDQDFASAEWGHAFGRLLALVEQHVEEEETQFFPKAQDVIDEDESKAILKRYEAVKQAAKSPTRA